MAPSKDSTKQSVDVDAKDVEIKDADSSSNKNLSEGEDLSLQIDDENGEVKSCESSRQVEEEEPVDGRKRSSTDSGSDSQNPTPAKKVRNKPKPQVVENMKEYIDNSTVEKLTTTTLRHWLRERDLHCSTRDKKAELIQKVKNHFVGIKS